MEKNSRLGGEKVAGSTSPLIKGKRGRERERDLAKIHQVSAASCTLVPLGWGPVGHFSDAETCEYYTHCLCKILKFECSLSVAYTIKKLYYKKVLPPTGHS